MPIFDKDDTGYLEWLATNPDGFVINTERTVGSTYVRLHRADCRLINGVPANGRSWTEAYIKVCGSEGELRDFADRERPAGSVWPCSRCLPAPPA